MAAHRNTEVRWFETLEEAKKVADSKNAEPPPKKDENGKEVEKRAVFKVYEIEVKPTTGVKLYGIGQTPSACIGSVVDRLGVNITRADYEPKVPIAAYLASLTPEEMEQAAKILKERRQEAAKKLPAA